MLGRLDLWSNAPRLWESSLIKEFVLQHTLNITERTRKGRTVIAVQEISELCLIRIIMFINLILLYHYKQTKDHSQVMHKEMRWSSVTKYVFKTRNVQPFHIIYSFLELKKIVYSLQKLPEQGLQEMEIQMTFAFLRNNHWLKQMMAPSNLRSH